MPVSSPLQTRELYGGAMTCAVPTDFFDVSDLREIPSTQEVFTHPRTDQSLIFDLLEYQNVSDQEAAELHFSQIAECNEALAHSRIVNVRVCNDSDMPHIPNVARLYLIGEQSVAKFNEPDWARNAVAIHMVLVRLPEHGTDIVITLNSPLAISQESSSAGLEASADTVVTAEVFTLLIQSFTIIDYSIFDA